MLTCVLLCVEDSAGLLTADLLNNSAILGGCYAPDMWQLHAVAPTQNG